MSTLTPYSTMNMAEAAKRRFNGAQQTIAMTLSERNDIIKDAPITMANDVWSHVTTRDFNLAAPDPRRFNAGAAANRSETEQIRDAIMLLELPIEIDEDIVDHQPDPEAFMAGEMALNVEGSAQRLAYYMVYGDPGGSSAASPPQGAQVIRGWMPRRSALGANGAATGTNCVGAGGTGSDLTSLYVAEWHPVNFHLVHPLNDMGMGIEVNDKGKLRVTDSSNNPFWAYVHQIKIKLGMVLADERALQRIANVEASDATNNFIDSTKVRLITQALRRLPLGGEGQSGIYVNRTVAAQLDIFADEKTNGFYPAPDVTGRQITTYRGVPVRMVEQISDTELAAS